MRGFTLIEVLVTILIMGIILAALFMALSMGQRSWFTGDTAVELRDQTVRAVMTMDRELSATRPSRVFDGSGSSLTQGIPVNSIRFDMPTSMLDSSWSTINTSGNIQWTGPITYTLNGSQIIRSFGGKNWTIGNNITNLQFTWTTPSLIQIDITAQKTPRIGQQIQDREQALIKMRN